MRYLDSDTIAQCHEALRDGTSLEALAGKLHFDTEFLGRLLQLPPAKPAADATEFDLWRVQELDSVL